MLVSTTSAAEIGTPYRVADIRIGSNGSYPTYLVVYDGELYFKATTSAIGLWKYNSSTDTASLVAPLRSVNFLAVYDGELYFTGFDGVNGNELWKYNSSTDTAGLVINIDGDAVTSRIEQLANPEGLELFDYHIHTPMASCSDNMDLTRTWPTA